MHKIIISSGDPAGIGPDIILKLVAQDCPAVLAVVGSRKIFAQRAAMHAKAGGVKINITEFDGQPHRGGQLPIIDQALEAEVVAGTASPKNANYTIACINTAAQLCLQNKFDAMLTAPVNKSSINQAGIKFSGHTEWIAKLCSAAHGEAITPLMMLVGGGMRVALLTTHLPLAKVAENIDAPKLRMAIKTISHDLQKLFGIENPRISVCGLNPHAGEDGYLGNEEIEIIKPTIQELQSAGFNLIGPVPADTAFTKKHLDETDAILAMYHDQGLPVIKHADFSGGVNITLGLPIIRLSVDHGTAFELAATTAADESSLRAALDLSLQIIANRK